MTDKKKKTGPGKGNRTRGADRRGNRKGRPGCPEEHQQGLREQARITAETLDHYKRIAEDREKLRKYNQTFAAGMLDRINKYIEDRQRIGKPLTIAGIIRASEMEQSAYYKARAKDYDHVLYEYMDIHGISYDREGTYIEQDGEKVLLLRLSEIIKRAELAVQEQLEENCYTNKGNPAGSIFGLKARYDWQDQPQETRTTNNNTLVLNNVASLDEAKEALKRLKG